MHCPFCNAGDTKVVDSRLSPENDRVRRRRECGVCGARFTTFEVAEISMPRVVKQDGQREAFNPQKIRSGMLRALEKRPVESQRIEEAIRAIENRMRASGERELASRQIGEWVMDALRQLDQVAYVRFASVYRSFQDVSAFQKEIERLQANSTQAHTPPVIPVMPSKSDD